MPVGHPLASVIPLHGFCRYRTTLVSGGGVVVGYRPLNIVFLAATWLAVSMVLRFLPGFYVLFFRLLGSFWYLFGYCDFLRCSILHSYRFRFIFVVGVYTSLIGPVVSYYVVFCGDFRAVRVPLVSFANWASPGTIDLCIFCPVAWGPFSFCYQSVFWSRYYRGVRASLGSILVRRCCCLIP